jgi:AcrR family transcriptional regulator
MDEIRARVGGSKATLYHYFASKDELFFEVVFSAIETEFEATHASLDPSNPNLSAALTTFGEGLLSSIYSPCAIEVRRLIFAEAKRSDLGRIAYERGTQRSHQLLSDFLRAAMTEGKLREADASMAAWHLYGLLDAKLLRRCLLHVQDVVTEDEIKTSVQQAVTVFMAAYGHSS